LDYWYFVKMEDDLIPDPVKSYKPKQPAVMQQTQQQSPADKADDLAGIDITDMAALEALAMTELVAIVKTAPRAISKIPAVKELMDRVRGKAPQSITMDVKDKRLNESELDGLLHLAAMMREPMVIAPMPKKLEE
jgi:hypothetical protein